MQGTYNVTLRRVFCSAKAVSITLYECVFVALGIQHAACLHRNVICGLSGSAIFSSVIYKNGTIFE